MGKLIQSQVEQGQASHIHKIYKEVLKHGEESAKIFQDLRDKYAKKDEKGKLVPLKDERNGAEIPDSWDFRDEEAEKGFRDEMKKMDEDKVKINYRPLTPATLKGIKLSAYEIDLLGDLFTEENGPGLPGLHSL